MNDGVLLANVCRSPCIQNNIRISHEFSGLGDGSKRIQLNWKMADEQGIDHFEVLRSFQGSDFTSIGYKTASAAGNYYFTDSNVQAGITYNYSLAVVTKSAEKCYSEIRSLTVTDGKPFSIFPNPSAGLISLSLNSYSGPVNITVTNVLGIRVLTKELNSIYGVPLKLDLSSQSKGHLLD